MELFGISISSSSISYRPISICGRGTLMINITVIQGSININIGGNVMGKFC